MPKTTDEILTDVMENEGGSQVTNDPHDGGGRTQYGISERSNPEAWADGKVTEEEARAIFTQKYVNSPGFHQVQDDALRAQLIDFGVNSGPGTAIQKLQEILHVTVDGQLGPKTLAALHLRRGDEVGNLLVAARVRMLGRIVTKNPSQLKWLNGWLDRTLQFIG